jgi:hypothetical protein
LKEERNIIRFGKPRNIPSSLDGIEIIYPYEIVFSSKEEYKLPQEKVDKKAITVSISGTLAISWGFGIWQPSESYRDLIKVPYRRK